MCAEVALGNVPRRGDGSSMPNTLKENVVIIKKSKEDDSQADCKG